jgi:exodeoxyribonuclease V gamma subunit
VPVLRVVYSNRTEELLAELAARVRAQQTRDGALVPVHVVVPTSSLEAYVRLGVARKCGIAANLQVSRLSRFAAELLADVSGVRVADAATFEALALTLLLDDAALAGAELAPVRAYLAGAGEADDPMDVRRVQLAARIGRIFEEYTHSRGELLASWDRGAVLGERHADVEEWQRHIWLAMFGPAGREDCVPLHQAVAALDARAAALPAAVHVFAFAHIARTFHDLFQRIAPVTDVVVYAVSPCEGFWEDADAQDPAPLRLWGRPGREQVRALNAMAQFDHDDRFVEPVDDARPGTRTLLRQLQRDVLRRERATSSSASRDAAGADGSIVVLEHAGVRRELEAVASEIWRLVESDPTLRFDEIALLVPEGDVARYSAQLSAVFREAHDLPHRMAVGAPLAADSRVAEAVDLLLALPLGRFTRQDLLRLALHPAVVASMDDVDPTRWAAWCDALGVVHGADRADHDDTYIQRDILNWDQGLKRLALGAFMAGDASGDPRPIELSGEQYVPYEVASSELRDASALGLLLRSLVADARFARGAELTMAEWAEFLRAEVETYVAPTGSLEEEHLARCLRCVHGIREVDAGGRRVRYRVACETARRRIAKLAGPSSGEGVVVSTLASLRPVSFRVVFACGMGEGQFPSPEAEDALDLRWAKRREGDVTARDRDKYGFLELLIGTRDRLYASYVSRDPLTGESLAPSSVVQDLLLTLADGYVKDPAALRRRHPLRRWDPSYFPELFGLRESASTPPGDSRLPEARAEARTLALRRDLDATGGRVDRDQVLARAATTGGADTAWGSLAEHLGLATLPAAASAPGGRVLVPIYAILKFLEFPLQGWARFRVGLDEAEDEDLVAREDEFFETARREETVFLRQVFQASIVQGVSLERAYDDAVRARELRGAGPSGVFASGERGSHLNALHIWRTELEAQGLPLDGIRVHRFGRGGEYSPADQVHDPLVLDIDVLGPTAVTRVFQVEVGGRTLPLGADLGTSATLFKRANETKGPWGVAGRERATLRAFVDHAILSASGVAAGQPHASVTVVSTLDGPVTEQVSFRPLSRDEATVWLRGVVRDLLQGTHAYFLPCEAVFLHARDPQGSPVTPHIEAARALLNASDGPLALRSAYGPVPRPHLYPAPDEESARAMVERRFSTFFTKRQGPS